MTFTDSAYKVALPYVTSGSSVSTNTDQPTISHYRFYQDGERLIGYLPTYAFNTPLDFRDSVIKTLQQIADRAAWATSDEIEGDIAAARDEVRRGIHRASSR